MSPERVPNAAQTVEAKLRYDLSTPEGLARYIDEQAATPAERKQLAELLTKLPGVAGTLPKRS